MIVTYIDEHRDRLGVEAICRVLTDAGTQIAASTYHAAKTRAPSARSVSDAATTPLVERVHKENYGVYGAPRFKPSCAAKGIRWRAARCSA